MWLAWGLILSLPAIASMVAFGLRGVVAFQIAGETSDRWAVIAASALRETNAPIASQASQSSIMEDSGGLSPTALQDLEVALSPALPARSFVTDSDGLVVHASAPEIFGLQLPPSVMQDLKKTGRLRSAADLITGVMLPTAVTESAAAIKHSGEVAGYAVVQMDRTELFNSIFFWVRVGVGGFTGAILLLGLPFIILLQRHFKDRSRVDQQLTLERETLALAIKAANAGFFENDLITGRMTWSPYLKEIMGYTDPAFSPTADFFGSLVHPEDHSELMAQGQQLR